jgi:hypothetical protein
VTCRFVAPCLNQLRHRVPQKTGNKIQEEAGLRFSKQEFGNTKCETCFVTGFWVLIEIFTNESRQLTQVLLRRCLPGRVPCIACFHAFDTSSRMARALGTWPIYFFTYVIIFHVHNTDEQLWLRASLRSRFHEFSLRFIWTLFTPFTIFSAIKLRANTAEVEIRFPAVAETVFLAHLPD